MSTILPTTPLSALTGPQAAASSPPTRDGLWGEDGFSFRDLLDIVNPLQHIPLVDAAYRAITGDGISAGAKLVGDTLLAGPIGFMASLADISVEAQTGADIGTHIVAALSGGSESDAEGVASLTGGEAPSPGDTQTLDRLQESLDDTGNPITPVAVTPNLPLPLIPARVGEEQSMMRPLSDFYADYRKAVQLSASPALENSIIA